jgi:hypothetical protein
MCSPSIEVPCGDCRVCCQLELLMVNVKHGEDVPGLQTYTRMGVAEPIPTRYVCKGADGVCVHLGPNGCEVYDSRPAVCREFDCRKWLINPQWDDPVFCDHDVILAVAAAARRLFKYPCSGAASRLCAKTFMFSSPTAPAASSCAPDAWPDEKSP